MNPLINIRSMPAEELQSKISELGKRLMQAHRTNSETYAQFVVLLETYNAELLRRTVEKDAIDDKDMRPGVVLDTEDAFTKEKDNLDKLIDIG